MSVAKNLLSGVASSAAVAVLNFAAVPFYLHYLGQEAYGLIAFLATVQGLFALVDLGLSQTVNREVARARALQQWDLGTLVHAVASLYWAIGLLLGLSVFVGAPWIAETWVRPNELDSVSTTEAIRCMGLVVFVRWPVSVYQGVLIGAERHVTMNLILAVSSLVTTAGGVALLAYLSRSIVALFSFQAVAGIATVAALRSVAWRCLGARPRSWPAFRGLRRLLGFSGGLTGVTVTAIVLSQLDKVLLSRLLTLRDFGRFMLAMTLARGLYLVIIPIFNVAYPRFSAQVAAGELTALTVDFRRGTNAIATLLFPVALMVSVGGDALLEVWTQDPELAASTASTVGVAVWAVALHGVMFLPYALQLAFGRTTLPLAINSILIVITVPATLLLTSTWGMLGGAVSGLLVNGSYVLLGTWITSRVILRGLGARWLLVDVGCPLLVSLGLLLLVKLLLSTTELSVWSTLVLAVFAAFLAVTFAAWISPHRLIAVLRSRLGKGATDVP